MDFFGLCSIILLIGCNGFFVAAEFALVKVRESRIAQLVSEGNPAARVVNDQMHHVDIYIAATQLGITIASLALGWIGIPAIINLLTSVFRLAGPSVKNIADILAVVVGLLFITTFHIIVGELVPKSIALQRSEQTALFVARPLMLFRRIFGPFIYLMNMIGGRIITLLGLHVTTAEKSVHTADELELLVMQSRKAGVLDKQEEALLLRVFDFSDKSAQQAMTPRTKVVGIDEDLPLTDVLQLMAEQRYTRYPVYRETLDTIIGVLHMKDVFAAQYKHNANSTFKWQNLVRPTEQVPESISIEDLLQLMRSKQTYMVALFDEYGGTVGIVTLEDIIEELVGEVRDEFDTREEGIVDDIEKIAADTFLVNGLMSFIDFAERFGIAVEPRPDQNGYHTVAGYLINKLDRLPRVGDVVHIEGYELSVQEMSQLRVASVKVVKQKISVTG